MNSGNQSIGGLFLFLYDINTGIGGRAYPSSFLFLAQSIDSVVSVVGCV